MAPMMAISFLAMQAGLHLWPLLAEDLSLAPSDGRAEIFAGAVVWVTIGCLVAVNMKKTKKDHHD